MQMEPMVCSSNVAYCRVHRLLDPKLRSPNVAEKMMFLEISKTSGRAADPLRPPMLKMAKPISMLLDSHSLRMIFCQPAENKLQTSYRPEGY